MTAGIYGMERQMKSMDRDYDPYGFAKRLWPLTYGLAGLGALAMLLRFWDEVHHHGWSSSLVLRIVGSPLIYICPLVLSLQSRGYNRFALKENFVSERVANNSEYFIGMQVMLVYLAFMQFLMWN